MTKLGGNPKREKIVTKKGDKKLQHKKGYKNLTKIHQEKGDKKKSTK